MIKDENICEETSRTISSEITEHSINIIHHKLLEESCKTLTRNYETLMEESFKKVTEKYATLLEESVEAIYDKYEALSSEMKYYIREGNDEIKTEVGKLRKEFEIATSSRRPSDLNFKISLDEFADNGQCLNYLAKSKSVENSAKFKLPFCNHFNSGREENTGLKSVLTSLKWRHFWYAVLVLLFVLGLSVALIILFPPQNMEDQDLLSTNYTDRLVPRGYWMAFPEKKGVNKLKVQPVKMVIVAHTAGSECTLTQACSSLVRTLQADAFSRGWSDISFNFLIGGDGYIYEGRGWDKEAAHTISYNKVSIGVAFMGNFARDAPPKRQLVAFKILLEEGVNLGKLTPDYKMLLQKQIRATDSPGAALINILMKWDHWSPEVPPPVY